MDWEAQQKRREVVAHWPDSSMIPVDESRLRPVRGGKYERIHGPEIAVKERLGPTKLCQRLRPVWLLIEKFIHPLKQAIPQR
jgi:hypothetical protein